MKASLCVRWLHLEAFLYLIFKNAFIFYKHDASIQLDLILFMVAFFFIPCSIFHSASYKITLVCPFLLLTFDVCLHIFQASWFGNLIQLVLCCLCFSTWNQAFFWSDNSLILGLLFLTLVQSVSVRFKFCGFDFALIYYMNSATECFVLKPHICYKTFKVSSSWWFFICNGYL